MWKFYWFLHAEHPAPKCQKGCIDNWIFNANGDSSDFLSVICWICKPQSQGHIFLLNAKTHQHFSTDTLFPGFVLLSETWNHKVKVAKVCQINQVLNPFGSDHLWLQPDILVSIDFSTSIHPCTLTLKKRWILELKTKKGKDELLFCTLTRSINPPLASCAYVHTPVCANYLGTLALWRKAFVLNLKSVDCCWILSWTLKF